MIGWRARLGFMVPPGNPTVEVEMMAMAPPGVTVHFNRMVAHGATGALHGQAERNQSMIDHIDETAAMLAAVNPDVIMLAHTATSYTLGTAGEAELLARLVKSTGTRVTTAFASVVLALQALGAEKVALGTPYAEDTTLKGKAHLEAHGLEVVNFDMLKHGGNIYDQTAEHAYKLARMVDRPEVQAIFLSGTGMPTITTLEALEQDLGKPVISSATAMLWHALRLAGVKVPVAGYGRLLMMV